MNKSIFYKNNLINVRLKNGEVMRLIEVIHNSLEIVQVVVQRIPEKCVKVMRLIEPNQIALPELILSTEESRKEISDNGGDLESLYHNANYLVIED
jgi:hypothetical protein